MGGKAPPTLEKFLNYLAHEKRFSPHTIRAYRTDLTPGLAQSVVVFHQPSPFHLLPVGIFVKFFQLFAYLLLFVEILLALLRLFLEGHSAGFIGLVAS